MSTHLPIRLLRPLDGQCLVRRPNIRPFSTTLTRARGSTASKRRRLADPVQTAAAARYQGGRASSAVYEEQLSDERNLPDDTGLLPGTFIRKPVLPNTLSGRIQLSPSRQASSQFNNEPWYMQVRARLLYDWKFLVSQLKSWMMLARFKYAVSKCPPLHFIGNRGMIKDLARERYVHLYRSFAQGDSKAISEMCLTGVAKAFGDRIAARPHGVTGEWKLKENGKVKTSIVSNRALLLSLSGYEDTGVHQIVLRMRSNQTLGYSRASRERRDKTLKYSAKEGQVVEYLVLQRQMIRGVFKDWKVWGFANEWDLDTIGEDAQYERELNAYQGSQAS